MKHIRNSVDNSIFLLEHLGIPVARKTDFNENIKNGSLCVDITNTDLYILKVVGWVKIASGFNTGDWIPLAGTEINKPVSGDIEIANGVKFYNGQSKIIYSDNKLVIGFSDNDVNTNINNSISLDRNYIIHSDDAVFTIDNNSKDNFAFKLTRNISTGIQISNSSNNKIFSKLNYETSIVASNNNFVTGNITNRLAFNNVNNSKLNINTSPISIFSNIGSVNGNLNIEQSDIFSFQNNNYVNINGRIYGKNTVLQNIDNSYVTGSIKNHTNYLSKNLYIYSDIANVYSNNNSSIYSIGQLSSSTNGSLLTNSTTSSLVNISYLSNIGLLSNFVIKNVNNFVSIGKNLNIKNIGSNNTLTLNSNGYSISNSESNLLFNNQNKTINTNNIYSKIDKSNFNILFNNNKYYSSASSYNIVLNTDDIKLYGSNNLIFTPKLNNSGFTGKVIGSNNVIFSLKNNKNYTITNNTLTFGDINSTSGIVIPTGNILMGKIVINPTLTTNNQIFGAKQLSNINHSGHINNIFLNVDQFIVPDSNTVYLPQKFYSINLGKYGLFDTSNISDNRTWDFPDKSGTVALLSDITASTSGGSNVVNLDDLGDVIISSPVNNQILAYDISSSSWKNKIIPMDLDGLTDVTLSSVANNQILTYETSSSQWKNKPLTLNLDGLTDATIVTPLNNQSLVYETATSQWKNKTLSYNLDALTDVIVSAPVNNNVLVYENASSSWKNKPVPNLSVLTNYNSLVALYNTGNLSTGTMYIMPHQTKHIIPNTNVVNTGTLEHIVLTATSSTSFATNVYSVEYPKDILYYDIKDDKVEDLSQSRQGKIYYRNDTKNNVIAWYDWRNVKFRRWDISTTLTANWSASSSFMSGTFVYYSNTVYKCIQNHTSGGSFDNTKFIGMYYNVGYRPLLIQESATGVVSDTTFQDFLTFETQPRNINIGRIRLNLNYNNIIFFNNKYGTGQACTDIFIDYDSFNMNICSAVTRIGVNCFNIHLTNPQIIGGIWFNIGDNCANIFLDSNQSDYTLGNNIYNVYIQGSNNKIGSASSDINITGSYNTIDIKSDNVTIIYSDYNTFGKKSSNILLNQNSSYNTFGINNYMITLYQNSGYNTFKDNVSNILFNSNNMINSTIESNIGNKTFFGMANSTFAYTDNNAKTFTNYLSNAIVDMKDSNDVYWYRTISTSGVISTSSFT